MNTNLEYYRVFYFVCVYKSISKASIELCISQPAVSQIIKHLEEDIGAKLFTRVPRGVSLTPEGEVLYSYVKRGYETIMIGEENVLKMRNLEHGEVKVGASDMTLQFYLLPYLEQFHEKYPDIKIIVSNAPTPEAMQLLYDGKIDFGIVSTPFSFKEDITAKKVKKINTVFVVGKEYSAMARGMKKIADLKKLPLICLEKKTSTRLAMDTFFEDSRVKLEPEFELATSDMIVQFALRNLGVGCVVEDFAKPYIDSGELVRIDLDKNILKRDFCVVTYSKNPISFAGEKLLEMLYSSKTERE